MRSYQWALHVPSKIWMDYITLIMAELEQKNKYIAIMDDLLLHSTKVAHWKLLEQLFQSMCKNGLKLSPKKCQLFRTKLTYMGNEFVINKRTMTITPLSQGLKQLVKYQPLKQQSNVKAFVELLIICLYSVLIYKHC